MESGFLRKVVIGIIVGFMLSMSTVVFGADIKEYILKKVEYPILVNGIEYIDEELPALNYEGNTYVPLRAVGDILGVGVHWNDELNRAEIGENTIEEVVEEQVDEENSDEPEVFEGYLKYKDITYLSLREGAEKYGLTVSWNAETRTVIFENTNIQVKVSDDASNGVDGFMFQGRTYIKESIVIEASQSSMPIVDDSNDDVDLPTTPLPTIPTNNIYDEIQSENDRHNQAIQEIENDYDKSETFINDQITKIKRESPVGYLSDYEFEKQQSELQTEQLEIQQQISIRSLDDSLETRAKVRELEEELAGKKAEIDELQVERTSQLRIINFEDLLDEAYTDYQSELNAENNLHRSNLNNIN